MQVIKTNGVNFYKATEKTQIPKFNDTKLLSTLGVKILKPDSTVYSYLTERGRKFKQYGLGAH